MLSLLTFDIHVLIRAANRHRARRRHVIHTFIVFKLAAGASYRAGERKRFYAQRFDETIGKQRQQIQVLPSVVARRNFGPQTVPKDQFLMLGDNRDNSADSRYIGMVPRELLIGRAVSILVSADIEGDWMPRGERFGKKLGAEPQ